MISGEHGSSRAAARARQQASVGAAVGQQAGGGMCPENGRFADRCRSTSFLWFAGALIVKIPVYFSKSCNCQ